MSSTASAPEVEETWQRIRRLRQAQIDAETEHGRQLAERYGDERPRPQFAIGGRAEAKRRRRR